MVVVFPLVVKPGLTQVCGDLGLALDRLPEAASAVEGLPPVPAFIARPRSRVLTSRIRSAMVRIRALLLGAGACVVGSAVMQVIDDGWGFAAGALWGAGVTAATVAMRDWMRVKAMRHLRDQIVMRLEG